MGDRIDRIGRITLPLTFAVILVSMITCAAVQYDEPQPPGNHTLEKLTAEKFNLQ